MHLFRSWSCLAAVSFVFAILKKAKQNSHAKDGSFYPLFANFVHVSPKFIHVWKTALKTLMYSSGHLEGSFVNINGNVAAISARTFRQKSKLLLENLEKFRGKKISENLDFFKMFLRKRIMLFWLICSKTSHKFLKKSKCIYLPENVTFLFKKFPSTKQKFFLEKHLLIQKTSLKERVRGKPPLLASSLPWNTKSVIQSRFIKRKEIFFYRFRFFTYYTASCTI